MTYTRAPMCYWCVHFRGGETWSCDAFPERIPKEIILGRWDHRLDFAGDRGILFMLKPGEELPSHLEAVFEDRLRGPMEEASRARGYVVPGIVDIGDTGEVK